MDHSNTRLYHPSGAAVNIVFSEGMTPKDLFDCVTACLDVGFTVEAPGLEEGEQKEEVGWVVRREKFNQDKSVTPIVDLYANAEGMKHPILSIYLNTDDDVAAFEAAAGTRLVNIPLYEGEGRIERGKNPRNDAKVWRATRPFGVVFCKNPKYDPEAEKATRAKGEVYGVPRRKFVRWGERKTAAPMTEEEKAQEFIKKAKDRIESQGKDSIEDPAWWKRWLATDPPLDLVTQKVLEAKTIKGLLEKIKPQIEAWKTLSGAWWDSERNCFMPPVDDTVPY